MRSMLPIAVRIVRGWTRLYTWRLPATVRTARLAEIESDLWEFQHDASSGSATARGWHVLLRLVAGLPDDLCWRLEQAPLLGRTSRRLVALTAVALLLSAAWLVFMLRSAALPSPPAAPMAWTQRPGPPPLPPPPPCQPPGFTGGCEP